MSREYPGEYVFFIANLFFFYCFQGENVLDLPLDIALRTTQEYKVPSVCPQVRAAVQNIIRSDTNNNTIVVKIAPHGFPSKTVSKAELENRFNKASRYTTEVYK